MTKEQIQQKVREAKALQRKMQTITDPHEKPERRTFEDIPSWKDVGCGYGTHNLD